MCQALRIASFWPPMLAAIVAVTLPQTVRADEFQYDLPEPIGTMTLDLGMSFSTIDSVSLRVTGQHTVGSYSIIGIPGSHEPYPAEIDGYLTEIGPFSAGFHESLPSESGDFDITLPYRTFSYEDAFDPLLDGVAEFNLFAFGPPLLANSHVTSYPHVSFETATLTVFGQPQTQIPLPGDFDGSGVVDHGDHELWRETFGSTDDLRAEGNGDGVVDAADYVFWRRHMTTAESQSAALTQATPEPTAWLLAAIGSCLLPIRRKRGCSITAA